MSDVLPKIELMPPDIAAYRRGNTGVDYVTRLDSGQPGPTVLINALTHGNEPCGAHAIDVIHRLGRHPARGSLILSFANVAAFHAFDPARPLLSRYIDEDMNRVWSPEVLDGPGDSTELRRARQLRPFVDAADIVLDLHSMQNPTDPLILCGRAERGRRLARLIGTPEWVVADAGHRAGRRIIDYDPFIQPLGQALGGKTAILVECGQHWERSAAVVAIQATLQLLVELAMVNGDLAASHLPAKPLPAQTLIEVTEAVTAVDDDFAFRQDYLGMEEIERAGTLIGTNGGLDVRTPYDRCVLIMPARRPRKGQTAVRLGRVVQILPPLPAAENPWL